MSNRRHVTQDRRHLAERVDVAEPHVDPQPHQPTARELAHERAMADRAKASKAAQAASQINSMRLKKGNAARHH
jgi:hypothetical protein